MANITLTADTQLGGLIATYYEKLLLERLVPQLYFDQFANKKPLPRNTGNSVIWTRLNNMAIGFELTEGSPPGTSAMSATKVSATPIQRGQIIKASDMFEMESISPFVEDASRLLGDGAAKTVDTMYTYALGFSGLGTNLSTFIAYTTSVASTAQVSVKFVGDYPYISNATVLDGASTAASFDNAFASALLNVSQVQVATTQLRSMNCLPMDDGYYVAIAHPKVLDQLMKDDKWASWNQYTNSKETMYLGEIGKVMGVRFVSTTNAMNANLLASNWSVARISTGGTLYGTFVFGKGAYAGTTIDGGNAIKQYIVPTDRADKTDALGQYGTVGYKITMAAKTLNPSCGVIICNYIAA